MGTATSESQNTRKVTRTERRLELDSESMGGSGLRCCCGRSRHRELGERGWWSGLRSGRGEGGVSEIFSGGGTMRMWRPIQVAGGRGQDYEDQARDLGLTSFYWPGSSRKTPLGVPRRGRRM